MLRQDNLFEKNRGLGMRLMNAKCFVDNINKNVKPKKSNEDAFEVPWNILDKYRNAVDIPRDKVQLKQLLRPKIFFDMELKNIRPLGRFVMQLFTEACPEVVMQFVRNCHQHSNQNMKIKYIFPDLWMSALMKLDRTDDTARPIEYDMRALHHESAEGIMSFSKKYLNGFSRDQISFSISFRPLKVMDNRRVAFGKLIAGLQRFQVMQSYANRKGRLTNKIVVTKIGFIR